MLTPTSLILSLCALYYNSSDSFIFNFMSKFNLKIPFHDSFLLKKCNPSVIMTLFIWRNVGQYKNYNFLTYKKQAPSLERLEEC